MGRGAVRRMEIAGLKMMTDGDLMTEASNHNISSA